MYQRIVCFKFKEHASPEAIQQHMDELLALKDSIPYIKRYTGGRAVSGDRGAAPAFDSLHYLTFDSLEDIDAYFVHGAHQRFIERNRHIWDSVLVLNADVEE